MAYQYVRIDGERVEVNVAAAYRLWAADFKRETGLDMFISSGVRTEAEQQDGYNRYLRGLTGGVKWAKPSESSHCEIGPAGPRALDIRDSGADAGVTVKGSARWKIAVQLGRKHGFTWGGWGVPDNEGWHFENHVVPVGKPLPAKKKETEVIHYHREDPNARGAGRVLEPGHNFWLHTSKGVKPSQASNVVGGVGVYSITPHVYATGTPGDVLELVLAWANTKKKGSSHSMHYTERLVIDKDGRINASREFKRAVTAGFAVYVRVLAAQTNRGSVKVTLLDCDAFLFNG